MAKSLGQQAAGILAAWNRRQIHGQDVAHDRLSVAAKWVRAGNILGLKGDTNGRDDHFINAIEIANSKRPLMFDWRKDPDFHV